MCNLSLNDLQCFVCTPGRLSGGETEHEVSGDAQSCGRAFTARCAYPVLTEAIEDELVRRTEKRRSLDGLFTPAPIASDVEGIPCLKIPLKTASPREHKLNYCTGWYHGSTGSVHCCTVNGGGGTERDIEQDLQDAMPPGVSSDGEVIDYGAYEAWQQSQHQGAT